MSRTGTSFTDEVLDRADDLAKFENYMMEIVRTLERTEPPPELRDFHKSYIDTFRPGSATTAPSGRPLRMRSIRKCAPRWRQSASST